MFTKLPAIVAITVGGSLVGIIASADLGPLTLEFGQTQLTIVCAVTGALFALTGGCLASEYADTRVKNQRQLERLTKLKSLIAPAIHDGGHR
jgi:hypothetical protein